MADVLAALALPWPFEREYMQLALAAGLVVGATAPLIGVFLVQRRLSLMGDGVGHLAFAGVAAGLLAEVWPVWTALLVAVLGALAVEWLRVSGLAGGDLGLALVFYGGIAAAVVLTSRAAAGSVNVYPYLFGSILTVDRRDVLAVVALGAVVVAAMAVCGRGLFAALLDEEAARVAGVPVPALNALLAVLTAVVVVAAMRVVGVLLIAALMVLPVAASRVLARSFRRAVAGAVVIGAGSVVVGLWAAREFSVAPGGAIVLSATAAFALAGAAGTLLSRRPSAPGTG